MMINSESKNSFKDVNDDPASRLYDSPVLMNSNESKYKAIRRRR